MNLEERQRFIAELCETVKKEAFVRASDMPDAWNGHELREYLAEKFESNRVLNTRSQRYKAYRNEVIVRNL